MEWYRFHYLDIVKLLQACDTLKSLNISQVLQAEVRWQALDVGDVNIRGRCHTGQQ